MTAEQLISFARGAPSLDIVDVKGLKAAAARAFDADPAGMTAYGTSVGYLPLRKWIADKHGVSPDQVIVTNGSLQADAFLFNHLVQAGDDVVVEKPTYDRTLLGLQNLGGKVHQITIEPDGMDVDEFRGRLESGLRPKLAHVIPNYQNPAGVTLSLPKRRELLALAVQYGFIIFEDDPYVDIRFRGDALPSMLSMDTEGVVVHASSFTKTVCPGVRVGYLVGPAALIDAIAKKATNLYISPGMVSEAIVHQFCVSGDIERSVRTVSTALAEGGADGGDRAVDVTRDAELVDDRLGDHAGRDVEVGGLLGDRVDQRGRADQVTHADAGTHRLGEAGGVHDRVLRVEGEHRGQRVTAEADVYVRVVLEDREAVLRGQGEQRVALLQRQRDTGRVLVVRDDVGELGAQARLEQAAQLVDVDAVRLDRDLVHLGAEVLQTQQGAVVGGLLHDHVVTRLHQVAEEERVGLQ